MFNLKQLATLAAIYGNEASIEIAVTAPKIAQGALDDFAALLANPRGFTPVTDAVPSSDRPVLALRRSGYTSTRFEVLTARYMPGYRPLSPWQTLSHDNVGDSGEPVMAWRYDDALFG